MIMKFAKQVTIIFAVSGLIILSYEALERWEGRFLPAWQSNFFTLLFISVIVAMAANIYFRAKNEYNIKLQKANKSLNEEANRQVLMRKVLGILNRTNDWNNSIKDILHEIKSFSKLDAVGIRLEKDNDYPYYAQEGFSSEFLKEENSICARNPDGSVMLDSNGRLIMECTCGMVISGKVPRESYITEKGSLWTNFSKDFLIPEKEYRLNPRNTCIHHNYMSVLLVPVRTGGKTVGLLQMNNLEPGKFSPEDITFFEEIADFIAIAYKRMTNEMMLRATTEKLALSEQKYRRLFEEDLAGNFITDPDGIITDCNSSLIKIFGYSDKKELVGRHIEILYSDPAEYIRLRKELAIKKIIINYEAKRKRQNGELIDIIKNVAASVDSEGRITEINGYVYDISDRKRAEQAVKDSEKYARTLLNTSGNINILINAADNRIIDINKAGRDFLGWCPTDQEMQNAIDLLEERIENIHEKVDNAITLGKTIGFQADSGNKSYFYQVYPIAGENGEIGRYAFFGQDITGMKQIRELRLLNTELNELNATKDKLFSIIAHDLKAPLSGILKVSELLRSNLQSFNAEKTDRFLESICCSSENMLVMLENLLIWAKTRNGNMAFSPAPLMITPLVAEIAGVLKASAANKNISVNNNVAADAFCFADANMFRTIIRNLIQNALKFTNPGGEIRIESVMSGNTTQISVADNGIGISPGLLNQLFEGGRSNSLSGTANEKGSGLGLVLCRDFAERNSGSIRVESEHGRGSTFIVTLPSREILN